MQCHELSAKREQCHRLYGKGGEECIVLQLEEKRCLAFRHCAKQAKAYYGTPGTGPKAICGSWAEAFCFASEEESSQQQHVQFPPLDDFHDNNNNNNNEMMQVNIQESHQQARDIVNANKQLKQECRTLAFELSKCLQKKLS